MTRETGELINWDDDRGFGFIARPDVKENLFFHIKALRQVGVRPKLGDILSFDVDKGKDGRPVAAKVEIVDAEDAQLKQNPAAVSARILAAGTLFALLSANMWAATLPLYVVLVYVVAGCVSFFMYGRDKFSSTRGTWRTPEKHLHYIDMFCGIAGGLVAQQVFRHKTSKPQFGLNTAVITSVHVLVLGLALSGAIDPGTFWETSIAPYFS